MWFGPGTAGYADAIKGRRANPGDTRTILAELYSPSVEDFLFDGLMGDVGFLVSDRARLALDSAQLVGFWFGPVEIIKVATKGRRFRSSSRGEPEDLIERRRNVVHEVALPRLHAVHVTGRFAVIPEGPAGGKVAPFTIPASNAMPDLWKPIVAGVLHANWVFCSDRFKWTCERAGLTNIRFEPSGSVRS